MIRYGALLAGIASIVLGVVGYLMHPPIPTEARAMAPGEAVAALDAHDRIFVTVSGEPDLDRKLYSTGLERPAFTARPTGETYVLPDPSEADPDTLGSYLGNQVRLEADLGPGSLSARMVSDRVGEEERIHRECILTPVRGHAERLWVASPLLAAPSEADRAAWTGRRSVEGALTLLRDVEANIESFTFSIDGDELTRLAAEELGVELDPDAMVVLAGEDRATSGLYRMPVKGTGDALFVMPFYRDRELPAWAQGGPIEGLMWAWDGGGAFDADLARAVGHALPARYGVIHHDETAQDHNRKTTFGLKLFTGSGAALLGVAAIAFGLRRRRR